MQEFNAKIDERLRAAQIIADALKVLPRSYTAFILGFYPKKYPNDDQTRNRIRRVFNNQALDWEILNDVERMTNELNAA